MSTPSAGPPQFALDGTVTREKLLELLAVETELPTLDYKRECNLSQTRDKVEIVKDIGAMTILSGYLVVGAEDNGSITGLPAGQSALFDQAKLSAQAARYLPAGLELRSAVHKVDDDHGAPQDVALIWVGQHPDGWCIFTSDGQYKDANGNDKMVFRAGQVYARHHTRSEPWNQDDITAARTALVARAKDAWRAEHREETQRALQNVLAGASAAIGPSGTYTWQLDVAGFEAGTVELLRRDDDIPVRRMLRAASADAHQFLLTSNTGVDDADLTVLLDRIAAVAALAVELHRPAYRDMATRALLDLYGWAVRDIRVHTSAHQLTPVLWLRIAERLYTVGALAVRLQDWDTVRELALAPVPDLVREYRKSTWHRDALTQASRARLFSRQEPDGRTVELSLLLFARAVAAARPSLRPDLSGEVSASYAGPDPLLDSLCQFDLLVTVVSGATFGAKSEDELLETSYPNYARADGSRPNAIVPALLSPAVRGALLPASTDQELAEVLDAADAAAHSAARKVWGWEGYTDPTVQEFLRSHLPRP